MGARTDVVVPAAAIGHTLGSGFCTVVSLVFSISPRMKLTSVVRLDLADDAVQCAGH